MGEIYSGYYIKLNKEENRAYKAKMLKIEGNSYQETREGYNLLPITLKSQTVNGVEITVNEDGSITLNGTATAGFTLTFSQTNIVLNGNYIFYLFGKNSKVNFQGYENGTTAVYFKFSDTNEFVTKEFLQDTTITNLFSYINANAVFNNETFKFMITKGTESKPYEQYGASPSMEFPSEVESCGDNVQLFDKNNANIIANSYVDGNGTFHIDTNTRKSFYLQCKPNTDYTISRIAGTRFRVATYNQIPQNGTLGISFKNDETGTKIIINSGNNAKYLVVTYYDNTTDTLTEQKILDSIKIEKGTKATPYSPYGQGSIEIYNCNENFLQNEGVSKTINGVAFTVNKDGTVIANGTATDNVSLYVFAEGSPVSRKPLNIKNGDYILSGCPAGGGSSTYRLGMIYSEGSNNYVYIVDNGSGISFNYDGKNVGVYCEVRKGYTANNLIFKPMIRLATDTDDTFGAHQSQTKTLYTQQPFRAIGDVKDRFVKKDGVWYEEHNIKHLIFTGKENWKIAANGKGIEVYVYDLSKSMYTTTLDIKSNMLKQVSDIWNISQQDDVIKVGGNLNNINILMKDITTLADFKAKLVELYNAGTPLYVDYVLVEPLLIPCTSEQSITLDRLENIQLYNETNHIYSTNNVEALLTLELYHMMEDYDMYISTDGFFVIPGTDIKFLINFTESSLPTMPEAVESSVRAAGRDGDYVLNTTYEPIPFEVVCYTEDNLTISQKKEIEAKVNRFLNSIKNKTKRLAFERDNKFYNVKYNNLAVTTNYPAHLKFAIPLKSSESYAKDTFEKIIAGNNSEISDTINPTGALITINGPATLPIIALNDYSMEYDTAILEGARVEIDTAKSTATHINSDGVKTNVMRYYNHQFPKIQPGENTLKVLSGVDDENNVTVKWNDLKL